MEMQNAANPRAESDAMSNNPDETIELELYDELLSFSLQAPETRLEATQTKRPDSADQPASDVSYSETAAASNVEVAAVEEPFFDAESILQLVSEYDLTVQQATEEVLDANPLDESIYKQIEVEPRQEVLPIDDEAPAETARAGEKLSNTSPLGQFCSSVTLKPAEVADCPACGSQLNTQDLFCIACGEFLDNSDAVMEIAAACGECQTIIGNDDAFCPACGAVTLTV